MAAVEGFFFAIALANFAAVWCIGESIGAGSRRRKAPPNFKAGAVDPHSTPRGVR